MTLRRPAVRGLDAMNVAGIEDALPGTDGIELVPQFVEELAVQDPGLHRGPIDAVRQDVPDAEGEIIEGRERDCLADRDGGGTLRRSCQEAQLGQGTDRLAQTPAHRQHSRDERRRERPRSHDDDPQTARGCCRRTRFLSHGSTRL